MDKISCIVLNYNDARTTCGLVEELLGINCLDSVVVVDNCSTDDSWVQLSGLARPDGRVSLIRAEQNGGGLDAYTALASQYSDLNDTDHPDGHFAALTKDDVEDTLEAWCFDPARQSGDSAVLRDETGVYLVYFNGFGETNLVAQAREQLLQERYEQWLEEHKTGHEVSTSGFGMLIAG